MQSIRMFIVIVVFFSGPGYLGKIMNTLEQLLQGDQFL